jgi:hypothetical protein
MSSLILDLFFRIREYLNYYWQSEQSVDTDEQG